MRDHVSHSIHQKVTESIQNILWDCVKNSAHSDKRDTSSIHSFQFHMDNQKQLFTHRINDTVKYSNIIIQNAFTPIKEIWVLIIKIKHATHYVMITPEEYHKKLAI